MVRPACFPHCPRLTSLPEPPDMHHHHDLQSIFLILQQLAVTKQYLCAATAILVYDHIITFSDEVEYVWKKMRSVVSVLFLINRYYTLFCMVIVMLASFSRNRSREACLRFAIFEKWAIVIPLVTLPSILLILRVHALYGRNVYVLLYLLTLLAATIALAIWEASYPGGGLVQHHPQKIDGFRGCSFRPSPNLGHGAGAYLGANLFFDVSVFALTMMQIRRSTWCNSGPALFKRIGRDGALYFVVIFSSVCTWLFMAIFAPWQIKWMNGFPTLCLIATMINRLTINIRIDPDRDFVEQDSTAPIEDPQPEPQPHTQSKSRPQSWQWGTSGLSFKKRMRYRCPVSPFSRSVPSAEDAFAMVQSARQTQNNEPEDSK